MTPDPSAYFPLFYSFMDFLWVPVAFFAVARPHRWKAVGFVLACLLTFRTQVEFMDSLGYSTGFLPLVESDVYDRGLVTYGVIITLYLLLAHFSPRTQGIVFFAASLSIYMMAFCVSTLIMAL